MKTFRPFAKITHDFCRLLSRRLADERAYNASSGDDGYCVINYVMAITCARSQLTLALRLTSHDLVNLLRDKSPCTPVTPNCHLLPKNLKIMDRSNNYFDIWIAFLCHRIQELQTFKMI